MATNDEPPTADRPPVDLDPRVVQHLKQVSSAQWPGVWARYHHWFRSVTLGGSLMRREIAWPAVAMAALLFYVSSGPIRFLCGLFILIVVYKAIYAQAHGDGYYHGYTDGVDEGVNRVLGLTEQESRELKERAAEMEVEEGMRER
ncbi:MAG TPA: hypothetical protein VNE16_13620 [Vicinamibacterales bacterium]|nr:hypothetical protein [Vicinamibacterales bacterium]